MIGTDRELQATVDRIAHFRRQVEHLRAAESDPMSYHLSAEGFLAEIDRMNLEVREYLALHPSEVRAPV